MDYLKALRTAVPHRSTARKTPSGQPFDQTTAAITMIAVIILLGTPIIASMIGYHALAGIFLSVMAVCFAIFLLVEAIKKR